MTRVAAMIFDTASIASANITKKQKNNLNRALQRIEQKSCDKNNFIVPSNFDQFAKLVYENGYATAVGSENSSGGGCQPLDISSVINIAKGLYYQKNADYITIVWV
jgi:hypothetical protein